jgi:4-hydroxybenzoate polyprenyltransferase
VTAPGKAPGASRDQTRLLPDSAAAFWLRLTPSSWTPFIQLARLDRPIGWQLLLLPCWQSDALAAVAARSAPNLAHDALFLVGAMAMRGAGSTYNDLIDREIDAQVERTRGRPLPSGRVTPRAAKMFLVAQCAIGAAALLCFNWFSVGLGVASLAIVAIYPFMKRITSWPQAVLGLAFAWGGLMGWAATFGRLDAPALLIYVAAICWTMGYDTIYALQDARDDAIVGVRSTARLFGTRVRGGVGLLYLGAVAAAAGAAALAGGGLLSYVGVMGFAAHCAWQLTQIGAVTAPTTALKLFRANRDAGLILFAGFAADALVRAFG